jgi:trehalose-phosphatase
LFHRLEELARSSSLLVASDFDGTIAPIVSEPSLATPNPQSMAALAALSRISGTHAAIVSGRALSDLVAYAHDIGRVHLIGSHGAELPSGPLAPLSDEASARLERLRHELGALARSAPGFLLEEKPASVAIHYRKVEEAVAAEVIRKVLIGPGAWRGVHVREGKKVL